MTKVSFYIDHRGNNPVGDFLDKNKNAKTKAFVILKNIEEFGLSLAIPHIKRLTGLPLWEIRILGKDSVRILYVNQVKEEIILLHAFKKKSQKTPASEINIALIRLSKLT